MVLIAMRSQSRTTTDDPAGTGPAAAATEVAGITASTATIEMTAITGVTQNRECDLFMFNLLSSTVRGRAWTPRGAFPGGVQGSAPRPIEVRLLTTLDSVAATNLIPLQR
jgi:hypothetical protein